MFVLCVCFNNNVCDTPPGSYLFWPSAPHATYKKGAGILKETPGNYEVHRVRIQADERLDEVPGEQANSTTCKNGGGPEALEPLLGLRRLPPALRR